MTFWNSRTFQDFQDLYEPCPSIREPLNNCFRQRGQKQHTTTQPIIGNNQRKIEGCKLILSQISEKAVSISFIMQKDTNCMAPRITSAYLTTRACKVPHSKSEAGFFFFFIFAKARLDTFSFFFLVKFMYLNLGRHLPLLFPNLKAKVGWKVRGRQFQSSVAHRDQNPRQPS